MSHDEPRQGVDAFIERLETPMLVLAGIAVAIYLVELRGGWLAMGLEQPYLVASVAIDLLFVVDLLLKVFTRGTTYLKTPWFLVDLFSTLPVLTHLSFAPQSVQALRFVRTFRLFRVLRALRALRVLRTLRILQKGSPGPASELEQRAQARLDLALSIIVVGYVAFFLGVATLGGTDDEGEFWLVLGSVVGMAVMLAVVRFLLPTLAAQQVRGLLNVALPHQVASHFLEHPESYDQTVAMPATVIFSDIAGFTTAVEKLGTDHATLKLHLEAALNAIVEAHIAQDLIVDKFIGDAVMSFRGGMHVDGTPEDHARRVVLANLNAVKALTAQDNPVFRSIKTGGASATRALIGTFGAHRRLSYTILGDRVNLAARLEGAAGKVGTTNLFCNRTRTLCGDAEGIVWRRVGNVAVSGKAERVLTWEAFDDEEDTSWTSDFEAALVLFEAADFAAAADAFRAVNGTRDGGDTCSRVYVAQCERLAAEGVPEGWKPVLVTRK